VEAKLPMAGNVRECGMPQPAQPAFAPTRQSLPSMLIFKAEFLISDPKTTSR
jgi:hypothetical protein